MQENQKKLPMEINVTVNLYQAKSSKTFFYKASVSRFQIFPLTTLLDNQYNYADKSSNRINVNRETTYSDE